VRAGAREEMSKTNSDINEIIAKALSRTITALRRIYNDGRGMDNTYNGPCLIFPSYSDEKKIRISEQELRFIFVEKISSICKKEKKIYYSIETPTKEPYTFSNGHSKIDPIIGEGQSGNFDMALHNAEKKKICLVEFKYGSVSKQAFMEVLAKLANPNEARECEHRYIIHMVEEKCSEACKQNLKEAINWLSKAEGMEKPRKEVEYVCFSLKKRERRIETTI